jgi:hypothetical protein
MRICAILERTSWAPRVPRRCGFRSGGCRDFPTILFSVAPHSTAAQFSIPPPAASKTTDAARGPSSRQRGHREGADKEGTLAAMKALRRELADPNINEHHGPDHTAGRDREPERQAVV